MQEGALPLVSSVNTYTGCYVDVLMYAREDNENGGGLGMLDASSSTYPSHPINSTSEAHSARKGSGQSRESKGEAAAGRAAWCDIDSA